MSTTATTAPSARSSGSFLGLDHAARHRLRLRLAWAAVVCFIAAMIVNGYSYYTLPIAERAYSPLHPALRPSGYVGIRLGLLGLALFAMLFLYPIRKRWPWLSRIGKTKHWLDFHVLFGISAPIVITLHSSLKLQGLAGLSYWIMIAVAVSGFVGRYLYSQIPRTLTAAELSFKELEAESARLAEQLDRQPLLKWSEIAPLLALPSREEVSHLSTPAALLMALKLDVIRPFRVSGLRRRFLSGAGLVVTLGGLRASSNRELEGIIAAVRLQSWLSAKLLLLTRMQEVFHLWHVVHRPFSYSFIVLTTIHITVAMLFGYY